MDAQTQTEASPTLVSRHTMTETATKSVGMWAFPATHTMATDTDTDSVYREPEPAAAVTEEKSTSPMKSAPITDTATSPVKELLPSAQTPSTSAHEIVESLPVSTKQEAPAEESSSSSSGIADAGQDAGDDYDPAADHDHDSSDDVSGSDASDVSDEGFKDKYVVFGDCLQDLLRRCPECGEQILETTKTIRGSLLSVTLVCAGNHSTVWRSQPIINRYAEGNLLISAAVFFAGSTYGRFHQICTFMGLKVPAPATFFRIQKTWLYPVVNSYWLEEKKSVTQALKSEDSVTLIGDARCDSPGYSAKYSTYSFMDAATGKIVEFEVTQVSQVIKSLLLY